MTASQADTKAARELKQLVPTLDDLSSVEITGLVRALFAHRKGLNTAERTARETAQAEAKAERAAKAQARKEAAAAKAAERVAKLKADLAAAEAKLAA